MLVHFFEGGKKATEIFSQYETQRLLLATLHGQTVESGSDETHESVFLVKFSLPQSKQ